MIKMTDATRLAITKLRTRKVRLFVTIFVSGLLFSALAGASMIFRGTITSFDSFSKEGFGERYIIQAYPQSSKNFSTDEEVIDKAIALNKELIKKKKIEAKRLGITYDPANEPSPIDEFDTPDGKIRSLRYDHPIAQQVLQDYSKTNPNPGLPELKEMSKNYNPKAFFVSDQLPNGPSLPSLKILKEGKESYAQGIENNGDNYTGQPVGTDSFTQGWGILSQDLLAPFLLIDSAKIPTDSIPVIAPYTATEQLLNMQALPSTTPTSQRLARLKEVREKAASITFQVCMRNTQSSNLLNQAISVQQELEKNKNNKDYVKPTLIYGLPKKACGPVTISSDTRTAAEKKLADNQAEFNKIFGEAEPTQEIINFTVIGIAPDPPSFNASLITSLVASLVSSNLGGSSGWYTPVESLQNSTVLKTLFDTDNFVGQQQGNYVEFNTATDAKKFIDEKSCQPNFTGVSSGPAKDPFQECADAGKPFGLYPYGSNSLALAEAKKWFGKIFNIAALVVAIIASVIMVGTVGRTLADSRRETAVFRAIGAKKLDITQIYIIYTIFLALLIVAFAIAIGFGLAQYIHNRYAAEFTIQALVAYNAQDLTKQFHLYNFYVPDLLRLIGLTIAAGLLSALLPLLRNLRRNPIKDMRDDT